MRYTILIFSMLLFLFACKTEKEDLNEEFGSNYYPLKVGSSLVYELDTIDFDEFNQSVDTLKSKIRIRILATFLDSANEVVHRVEYDNPDKPFAMPGNRRVGAIKSKNNKIVEYTDTGRIIKVVFPVRNSMTWDVNLYNTFSPLQAKYEDKGIPYTVNGVTYDHTVRVQLFELINPVTEIVFREIYAPDIGLIYSENTYILRIGGKTSGRKIIHKLISYD